VLNHLPRARNNAGRRAGGRMMRHDNAVLNEFGDVLEGDADHTSDGASFARHV
jgi:hypothetical protein